LKQTEFNLVISADRINSEYWKDLWRFRELFYFLAWRDILVRYKQTVIGLAWSLLRPLLTMIVFAFVFGKLAKLPSGGLPYPIIVLVGMLPWQFFSNSLSESSSSLITNASMISKVYFPRLIVPVSSVITSLIDFMISLTILALAMAWYRVAPTWRILYLPGFLAVAFAASIGVGVWLSALTVKYRDFRYIIPFIVQFGLYVSPIGFTSDIIPEKWRLLYSLNPMVGVVDGFRWSILGRQNLLDPASFGISTAVSVILLASGLWYFRKMERGFADVI
jgi:lipopolysaccharide transport system permease protein